MAGWNCAGWARESMASVEAQTVRSFDVCVTDDASRDGTHEIVREFCEQHGWTYFINTENRGTLWNQVGMIRAICTDPDDVIVFVDLDDRLAHERVFEVLDRYYATGIDMAYGSYVSEPFSATCVPSRPYPPHVVRHNSYRHFARFEGGIVHNHLRTFKYKLFQSMQDSDFTYEDGTWLKTGPDSALMFPALELSGGNWAFMPEILYIYNSENAQSDWRRWPRVVDAAHARILDELPPKQALPGTPAAEWRP